MYVQMDQSGLLLMILSCMCHGLPRQALLSDKHYAVQAKQHKQANYPPTKQQLKKTYLLKFILFQMY